MPPRFADLVRPPRRVPFALWAGVMINFHFIFGTMFFVIGMCIFWLFSYPSLVELRFTFGGALQPARGRVILAEKTSYSEGGSRHSRGTPVWRYRFRFPDAQGEQREGVSYTTGDRIAHDADVEIEFVPGNPGVSRIIGARASPFGLMTLFVCIFPAIGLPVLVVGVRKGVLAARLLAEGKVAYGRILSQKPTGTRINNQPVIDFEVEFTTPIGRPVVFHYATHQVLEIGDEPEEPVFYDPARPEAAVLADGLPAKPVLGPDGNWLPSAVTGPAILFSCLALAHVGQIVVAVCAIRYL